MLKVGVIHRSIATGNKRARGISHNRFWRRLRSWPVLDFTTPNNLLVLTCHNYEGNTAFEFQMNRYSAESEAYKVVKYDKEKTIPWSHFLRWKGVVKYLESDEAKDKEYVICCDPTDVLFFDSPSNILDNFLEHFDCDLLYNATSFRRQYRWEKYTQEAHAYHNFKKKKFKRLHNLNSGLFIGKKDFVIEVYKKMLSYELDSDGRRDESTWWKHPEFPYGCTNDQQALRYIEHEYYPRLQIDGKQKLLARCNRISHLWRKGVIRKGDFECI